MNRKGFTLVELLVVIAIIGILAGSLFPVITGAMTSARLTDAMSKGKGIVQAIITLNMNERKGAIWPKTQSDNAGGDNVSIYNKVYSNSSDYFWDLLDGQNMNDPKAHNAYSKDLEWDMFSGPGVPPVPSNSTKLDWKNNMWTIAANVPSDSVQGMSKSIPVLLTRNVDCKLLTLKYASNNSKKLTNFVAPDGTQSKQAPFGREGFVLVRAGGQAEKHDTTANLESSDIYKNPFDISSLDTKLTYLSPEGEEAPSN